MAATWKGGRHATTIRHYRKKREWLNKIKDVPCLDCGIKYPPYVMSFDHRDSSTKGFDVGRELSHSFAMMAEEIMKCDIVCMNCHMIRTWKRNGVQ